MKFKYSLIGKLHNVSSKEFDLLCYIIRREDQKTGCTEGIYYSDVIKNTGMCRQSFYNALNGLKEKGIIEVTRVTDMDYNIRIPGNEFHGRESYQEGYVNLNRKAFHSKAFKDLKAHEKYMLLEFLKGTHENGHSLKIGVDKLYEKFMNILGVSKRVIRGYLHNLRKFFSIGIKDGNYFITYLHSVFEKEKKAKTEELWRFEHMVKKECWRNHISYDAASLHETAGLVKQYRDVYSRGNEKLLEILMLCIRKSIEGVERKQRALKEKYVHKLVKECVYDPDFI